jgi:hypothetical protein
MTSMQAVASTWAQEHDGVALELDGRVWTMRAVRRGQVVTLTDEVGERRLMSSGEALRRYVAENGRSDGDVG